MLLPLKKPKLKKPQEREYEVKRNLKMENQNWNDWKFQIYWNKLEWVNRRSRIQKKRLVCVSYKRVCLKDNNKTAHCVCH